MEPGPPAYEISTQARYQIFATNSRRGQTAFLDARHRTHARVEPKIRDQKASGMGLLPPRAMTVNTARLTAAAIASDLRAWLQLLALDGEETKATRTNRPNEHREESPAASGTDRGTPALPGTTADAQP